MKSLQEKVREGMTDEECCDVLFSMVSLIEEGKPIGNCPEEVLLDEENRLSVWMGLPENLVFCPPEMLAEPPAARGQAQQWFTLGMFAYYMYYKKDFYTQKRSGALAPRPGCQHVIMPADVSKIPFGTAVSALTALNPEERVKGLRAFLAYLTQKMPGTAELHYVFNGRRVGKQTKTLSEDIEDLWPGGKVKIGEKIYDVVHKPVRIPYRPGTHHYDIELTISPAAGNQKPADDFSGLLNQCFSPAPGGGKQKPQYYLCVRAEDLVAVPNMKSGMYIDVLCLNDSADLKENIFSVNFGKSWKVETRRGRVQFYVKKVQKDGAALYENGPLIEFPKDFQEPFIEVSVLLGAPFDAPERIDDIDAYGIQLSTTGHKKDVISKTSDIEYVDNKTLFFKIFYLHDCKFYE